MEEHVLMFLGDPMPKIPPGETDARTSSMETVPQFGGFFELKKVVTPETNPKKNGWIPKKNQDQMKFQLFQTHHV